MLEAAPRCWQGHFYHFLAERGFRSISDLHLKEVVEGFACEYAESYGFDFFEDEIFRSQLSEMLGSSMENAVRYAEGDDRSRLMTNYERFVSEVQDQVFFLEQKEIDGEEKQELDKLRRQHEREQTKKASAELKKERIRSRLLTYLAVTLIALLIIALKLHSAAAVVLMVIVFAAAVVILAALEK